MTPEKKKALRRNSGQATPKKKTASKKALRQSSGQAAPKKKAPAKKVEKVEKEVVEPAEESTEKSSSKKKDPKAPSTIRIRLSAFDHIVLDEAVGKIIDTAERTGAIIHGPIPLPTKIRKFTVNRSTFVHKDARDQFEMRTHRRLIDLKETTFKTIESLQNLSLPSGVDIEIKMS